MGKLRVMGEFTKNQLHHLFACIVHHFSGQFSKGIKLIRKQMCKRVYRICIECNLHCAIYNFVLQYHTCMYILTKVSLTLCSRHFELERIFFFLKKLVKWIVHLKFCHHLHLWCLKMTSQQKSIAYKSFVML